MTTRHLFATAILLGTIIACGSDPKKEPTAATAEPSATPPPTPATASASAAPTAAAPADAGGGKSDKATQCEGWVDDANNVLDAERIAVDKPCKKDADCIPIKGRACMFNCVNAAIPKSEEKEWNESLTKVKDGPCKKWTENECEKLRTKPPPTCQERKVACNKGHCELKEGK